MYRSVLAQASRTVEQVKRAIAGDLESPGQLEQIAAARSYNKEIIVIASNQAGAKLAFNLILSLQAQGISHYIWLTDDPTYCKALHYSPLQVACATTSYLAVCQCWHSC
jgi:lysine/ornithine N-monooxygenase